MSSYSLFVRSIFLISFGGALLLYGCAASAEYNPSKMDTSLNQKVSSLEKENPDTIIQFTGKTIESINDEMKTKLEETGIKIETVANDIFTATGNVESVKKVSLFDFVISLELVKKLDIK